MAKPHRRYQVKVGAAAAKALAKLPDDVQRRIGRAIDALETNPRPPGVRKLTGSDDLYRIRVGDYRIIYEIPDRQLIVLIVRIGHRRDVYGEGS